MKDDLDKGAFKDAFKNTVGQVFQVFFAALLTATSQADKDQARARAKRGLLTAQDALTICLGLCDEVLTERRG